MAQEKLLSINFFNGGLSSGSKIGLRGSFRWGQGLDIHSDPDLLQVMPASTKESGAIVTDLVLFGANNTVNANRYFLGDAGALYKRTSAPVWSKLTTYTNAQGMGFFSGTNKIFFVSGDREYQLDPANDAIATGRTLNTADFHPIEAFLDKVFIGNGRELISTDGSNINGDSTTTGLGITIDFNYKIRCMRNIGSWLFIGATSANSSDARYFLWDGVSEDYNYARTLKGEDGINAVEVADDGTVLIHAGKQGHIYQLTSVDAPLIKLKELPRIEKSKTIETYPGATANYQGRTLFGFSTGSSLTAERGVYSYSSTDKNYAKTFNMEYAISTGTTTGITLQIGCLLAANTNELFIGWRDDTTYGVDVIDGTSVQATALLESLVHDDNAPYRRKYYNKFKVKLAGDLATGEVVTLSYKADRASTWTDIGTLDYSADAGINVKRFRPSIKAFEIEIKVALANASGTAPSIDNIIIGYTDEPIV